MGDSCEDRLCDSRVHVGWSQLFLPKAWRPSPLETRVPFPGFLTPWPAFSAWLGNRVTTLETRVPFLDSSLLGEASELAWRPSPLETRVPFPGFLTPSPLAWRPSPLFSEQVP